MQVGAIPAIPMAPLFKPSYTDGFEERNLDVSYDRASSGADITTFITQDKLEVGGGAPGATLMNALRRDLPIKVVAPLHAAEPPDGSSPSADPIMAAPDSGVTKIGDMKGKTIAINARGVATAWMVDLALQTGGLSIEDVNIRTMPFPDMVPAMKNSAIDACIIPEPLATVAESKIDASRILEHYAPGKIITTVNINTNWAEKNPEAAKRYMVAHLEGVRQLHGQWTAEENVSMIADYMDVPENLVKNACEYAPPYSFPNLKIDWDSLSELQRWLLDRDVLDYDEPLPEDQVVDHRFVEHAREELGTV